LKLDWWLKGLNDPARQIDTYIMGKKNEWRALIETTRLFILWSVNSLLEAFFLALWGLTQWFVNNKIISPLDLKGIDRIILTVFQFLFAISTLAPVVITIYRDIRIMLLQTKRKIQNETKLVRGA
jgi:hypothetical protein